jgi:hypothetical protein
LGEEKMQRGGGVNHGCKAEGILTVTMKSRQISAGDQFLRFHSL